MESFTQGTSGQMGKMLLYEYHAHPTFNSIDDKIYTWKRLAEVLFEGVV